MSRWWVGGYGLDMGGTLPGIQAMRSTDAGTLELVGTAVEALSPSYLLQRGDHLYAGAEGAGTVDSFRRVGEHGLVRDGSAPSGGVWPCSLEFFAGGLAAANYFDGSVSLIGLVEGAVSELLATQPGSGRGPHEEQGGPHAHSVFAVDGSTLLSADLGSDRILVHQVGLETAASLTLPPGSGPRDIVRHPSGLLYVLGELSDELFVLRWTGTELELVSSVALPGAVAGDAGSAISFGAGGRYVYAGLRGSNRIAILRASDDGTQLDPVGSVSSEGDHPRHHAVDGDVLHVANQLSDSIASFRLGTDGIPHLITDPVRVPSPNYLLRDARVDLAQAEPLLK